MTAFNRRHFLRHKEESGMKVFLTPNDLNHHKDLDAFIPVKMCNESEEGLYIETDRALTPGLNVSIKMVASEDRNPQEAYYVNDGRVIWCKKVADDTSRFGVGVKVLREVVAADVLTSRFEQTGKDFMNQVSEKKEYTCIAKASDKISQFVFKARQWVPIGIFTQYRNAEDELKDKQDWASFICRCTILRSAELTVQHFASILRACAKL